MAICHREMSFDSAGEAILSLGQSMHENIYAIGKHLRFVKREVGHANFLSWLAENIQAFNRVTAAKYMDYVKRCELVGELVPYLKCTNVVHLEPTEPIPDGKYPTIVMDPPWKYGNLSGRQKPGYAPSMMDVGEISEFGKQLFRTWGHDEFCHLYLWVTDAYIGQTHPLLASWGFETKVTLVWVKFLTVRN